LEVLDFAPLVQELLDDPVLTNTWSSTCARIRLKARPAAAPDDRDGPRAFDVPAHEADHELG
jgi:hypothetical protein